MAKNHGVPFDYDGWMHILNEHDGLLPVKIKAIPEGTLIPVGCTQLTIESTDSKVPWIAGFLETILMKTYYQTTVATKAYHIKQMLLKYGSPEWAQFALHHFGDRAGHCPESSALSGFAHATQFSGSDNFNSLFFMEDYYNQPIDTPACYSVWASEHSSTTANCQGTTPEERLVEEEEFVYQKLIENPDRPIMSFVADSTDVYAFTNFCTAPNSRIRKLIESRPHQKLVLRPDSGDPLDVISKMLRIMLTDNKVIWSKLDNGKYLFNDFAILWGDGIDTDGIEAILQRFTGLQYAAENFVFGMGGGLATVDIHRDTQKFAIKCSSITISHPEPQNITVPIGNGNTHTQYVDTIDIDVYKDPITDPGKASKRGKVTTWYNTETKEYIAGTVDKQPNMHCVDSLVTIFEDGKLLVDDSLETIRARS